METPRPLKKGAKGVQTETKYPRDVKRQGGTVSGEEEAKWRKAGVQDCRHNPNRNRKVRACSLRPEGVWGVVI